MSSGRKNRGKRGKNRKSRTPSPFTLPVLRQDVAGIDIGSREHWVSAPLLADGQPNVSTFGTTTRQLEHLADWLQEQGVESVAMESTSVYWIPIYELLESRGFEVLLVNARQLKNVPGRKTDMLDCQWIRLLHSCGLLRGSFRPSDEICRLRALQRQRENLVYERTKAVQWMQKALDQMNVQVHHAVTDITGKTGMDIIRAIVSGERDPKKLATLRDKRCKKSESEIAEHLTGNWRDDHLFNLGTALQLFDTLAEMIAAYDMRLEQELEKLQRPECRNQTVPTHPKKSKEKGIIKRGEQSMRTHLWRFSGIDLTRIDGVAASGSLTVLTEVGPDLTQFPTEDHFVSWLRLSPKRGYSAGRPVKKTRNGMGASRVAAVLRMAAQSLQRSQSAMGAYFRRISRRKGYGVAIFATARKIAQHIYRMLRYGQDYVDIGQQGYEAQFKRRRTAGIKAAAKELGYELVPIQTAAAEQVSG